jgi:hypothetical protein
VWPCICASLSFPMAPAKMNIRFSICNHRLIVQMWQVPPWWLIWTAEKFYMLCYSLVYVIQVISNLYNIFSLKIQSLRPNLCTEYCFLNPYMAKPRAARILGLFSKYCNNVHNLLCPRQSKYSLQLCHILT